MQNAEADRRRDSQRSDQLSAPFRDLRGRLGYFAENAFCALQETTTVFRQHQFARGAKYQRRTNLRSSSAKRSLTTDLETCRRRAASLIDPASAVVTKASRESSFSIVRLSRTLVPLFAV